MRALPDVTITSTDRQRLISLATAAMSSPRDSVAASMLLREIARGTVVPTESLPPNVVGLNCEVEVRDNIENAVRQLRIVFPSGDAFAGSDVSVLTPLGASLLGLSEGASIDWCTVARDRRSFTVLRVRSPALETESTPH